jgi:TonB family protein
MDCREFERLLWDGPGKITSEMQSHLETCPKCTESYARFKSLFNIARDGEIDRPDVYWQKFDRMVWNKIEKSEKQPVPQRSISLNRLSLNIRRLSLSAGLATLAVVLLVVAIVNISRKSELTAPPVTQKYRTYDVTLKSEPPAETKGPASEEKAAKEKPAQSAKKDTSHVALTQNAARPTEPIAEPIQPASGQLESVAPQAPLSAPPESSRVLAFSEEAQPKSSVRASRSGEETSATNLGLLSDKVTAPPSAVASIVQRKETSPPQITTDQNQMLRFQSFSILPEPKQEKQRDSGLVSIDAVYLTDDGLKDKQLTVAQSITQEALTGVRPERIKLSRPDIQATSAAEPMVIELSKMPHAKHLVTPNFPSLAYSLGKEGEVWVKAYLDDQGKVQQAEIYKGTGTDYGFEEEALNAAYKNEFEPLEVGGQKMPAWIIYKVKFIREK